MTVKVAKERIKTIETLMNNISEVYNPAEKSYGLMVDAVSCLGLYTETLQALIDKAELGI